MKDSGNVIMGRQGAVGLLVITAVFGSLWGLSEVVVGGGLRSAEFPYRAGLLTGIGFALLGMALATSKKPYILAGAGMVAALVTLLVVPILSAPITCRANSCIAIATEAASLSLAGVFLMKKPGNVYARMGGAAGAALLASAAFYFIGTRAAPCAYLLSFTSPGAFMVKEGLVWAAFSAVLFPFGYMLGEKLSAKPAAVFAKKANYYASTAAVLALCWGFSALAIANGF